MRLIPQSVDELDPNLRWGVAMRLRLIEEVVGGPQVSWVDAPGKEEAMKRILRAWECGDRKAEEEAVEDCMRADGVGAAVSRTSTLAASVSAGRPTQGRTWHSGQ